MYFEVVFNYLLGALSMFSIDLAPYKNNSIYYLFIIRVGHGSYEQVQIIGTFKQHNRQSTDAGGEVPKTMLLLYDTA